MSYERPGPVRIIGYRLGGRADFRRDTATTALAPRRRHAYRCPRGHTPAPTFAADVDPPPTWRCSCGADATRIDIDTDTDAAPPTSRHLAYVLARRSPAERAAGLAEALAALHPGDAAEETTRTDGAPRRPRRRRVDADNQPHAIGA